MADKPKYALHAAARDGRTAAVEHLANPKLLQQKDDDDRLPIHWAVSYGHVETVHFLTQQKGFEVDAQDGSGWTCLMMASSLKDREDLVRLFTSRGADVNVTNNLGQTALHFAISKGNGEVAKLLLSNVPPASARVKDKRGQYAIHRAAAVGSVPMLRLLLEHKSPLNASDAAGQTPLHHAIAEGHGAAAVALLRAGGTTDSKDADGFLALNLAPDAQVKKFIEQSIEREDM